MSSMTPQTIDHHYRVLEPLGSGLSGEVYRVQGPEGKVALKLLRSEAADMDSDNWIATFKFEFSLLKGLNHPNVIRIFDFGFDQKLKRFYYTQELVEGAPIQKALPNDSKDQLAWLQNLFVQALQALAYLHSHAVIHGDLKSDNLLIHQGDQEKPLLKLIDFGISHPQWVQFAGTPATLAPEKILREAADGRSDLYSLAVVFYTLITGTNPFLRPEARDTLQAQLHFIPPPATNQRPALAPFWSELLQWMLKKNPRERAPSAEACLKFLETKGENFEISRPRLLPQHWTGRPEILENTLHLLSQLQDFPQKTKLIKITGAAGLGQESLITELKYAAELKNIEVLTKPDDPIWRTPALLLLKPEQLENLDPQDCLEKLRPQASLIFAVTPSSPPAWQKLAVDEELTLRPLKEEETRSYLQEVTRHQKIPQAFLAALQRISGGVPQVLHEALTHLLKDPKIVDASGKWHLAVFEETEPSLAQLGLSKSALIQVMEQSSNSAPAERWEWALQLGDELAQTHQEEEAFKKLKDLENQVPKLFSKEERLFRKAQLLEKRGYLYTKQGRFSEGRESFSAGLSLLKEYEHKKPVLEVRLENFLAYLDMQEGKIEAAIAQFRKNDARAQNLPMETRRQITNNELGSAYSVAGQLGEAAQQLEQDLKFFSHLGQPYLQMKAGYNLAETYFRQGRYPEALHAYEQSAQLARQESHWDFLLRAYNGMGNTATAQKNRLNALDYYQRALSLAEYLQDYLSAATIAQNRGVILTELDRLLEALQDLEISKRWLTKVQPSSHSRYLMARAILELGEVALKQEDLATARNRFSEALSRAEEDASLKNFRFYPLLALAKLALREGKNQELQELKPQLTHLAEGEEEKKLLNEVLATAPSAPPTPAPSPPPAATSTWMAPVQFSQEALYSILKINRALITEHDPEQLFSRILEYATELSGAESALLLEVSDDNQLHVRSAYNTPAEQAEQEISQRVAQRVLATGRSIATHDALDDVNFNQFQSVIALKLRSIACIPIRLHQKVIGLLYLTHRNRTQVFQAEVLRLMEAFGDQTGLALHNANLVQQLKGANEQLQSQLNDAEAYIDQLKTNLRAKLKNPYPKILGQSPAMVELLRTLDRISDTPLTVLILGETGSGKELIARSIHDHSRRKNAAFVAVNCGAIPENLMESELFGYVKGAFTGADRDKKGLIEVASGGTLFLDEVAELPASLQVKLLRTLQEKEIMRLGSTQHISVDVRVIAATHRRLEQWVQEERFREDLYYRLAQMVLTLPPLRERMEDLPLLAEHFVQISAAESGEKKIPHLNRALLDKMMQYSWPGNVRELENMIRTASAFAERGKIAWEHLPEFLQQKLSQTKPSAETPRSTPSLSTHNESPQKSENQFIPFYPDWNWERYEASLLAQSYLQHEQNCEAVAEALGIGIATVYAKLRKYKIKQNLKEWTHTEFNFSKKLKLHELKQHVIEKNYQTLEQSPYAVAKQLELNVGTVYRYLREE